MRPRPTSQTGRAAGRAGGKPGFQAHETELIADLSAPLATAIRERSRAPALRSAGLRGPGLLLCTAAGVATAEIAARLHLSRHTVHDYIKTVFEKVGVSSRGELVATLFADHYAPAHLEPSQFEHVQS